MRSNGFKKAQIVLVSCKLIKCLMFKSNYELRNRIVALKEKSVLQLHAQGTSVLVAHSRVKLGQSIDASFVRILGCPGEQRGFSIILSPTDG